MVEVAAINARGTGRPTARTRHSAGHQVAGKVRNHGILSGQADARRQSEAQCHFPRWQIHPQTHARLAPRPAGAHLRRLRKKGLRRRPCLRQFQHRPGVCRPTIGPLCGWLTPRMARLPPAALRAWRTCPWRRVAMTVPMRAAHAGRASSSTCSAARSGPTALSATCRTRGRRSRGSLCAGALSSASNDEPGGRGTPLRVSGKRAPRIWMSSICSPAPRFLPRSPGGRRSGFELFALACAWKMALAASEARGHTSSQIPPQKQHKDNLSWRRCSMEHGVRASPRKLTQAPAMTPYANVCTTRAELDAYRQPGLDELAHMR